MPFIPLDLPAPPQAVFSLATPHHMLIKFSWEIRQLKISLEKPSDNPFEVNVPSFIAFNCAVTGWHLADWTWNATDEPLRKSLADHFKFDLKSANRNNLSTFYDRLSADCREIYICRMIANGSKHMKLDRSDPSIAAKVERRPCDGVDYGLTVVDNDETIPAQEVFEGAFKYWVRVLSNFGFIEDQYVGSDDED
jgi:hypothetical protein